MDSYVIQQLVLHSETFLSLYLFQFLFERERDRKRGGGELCTNMFQTSSYENNAQYEGDAATGKWK